MSSNSLYPQLLKPKGQQQMSRTVYLEEQDHLLARDERGEPAPSLSEGAVHTAGHRAHMVIQSND